MKIITLAEFVEDFITHIDKNILIFSENQIDTLIEEIHDEPDVLEQLLIEVEKKRDHYFHQQGHYDYTALKPAAICVVFIVISLYLLYCIIIHYCVPLKRELAVLIKKLGSFDITVIQDKKEGITLVTKASKRFTQTEALVVKDLIRQIYDIDSSLHSGTVAWTKAIITIVIALMIKPTFDRICRFFWPQYKKRYEKYCLIEQKLHEAIHIANREVPL